MLEAHCKILTVLSTMMISVVVIFGSGSVKSIDDSMGNSIGESVSSSVSESIG